MGGVENDRWERCERDGDRGGVGSVRSRVGWWGEVGWALGGGLRGFVPGALDSSSYIYFLFSVIFFGISFYSLL